MSADFELVRLILIRHADAGRGRADSELSDMGREQARRLCERLRRSGELGDTPYLVTSDLRRSIQTAEYIAGVLEDAGLAVPPDPNLQEMSWGDTGPPETWNEFEARARATLRRYVDENAGRTVVAVCHTGVIEASFIEFAELSARSQRFAMRPRNTSITTWAGARSDGGPFRWRLEAYNDAEHLWAKGALCHGDEEYGVLASGHEPFWAEVETRATES